jgi:hypothetical protein
VPHRLLGCGRSLLGFGSLLGLRSGLLTPHAATAVRRGAEAGRRWGLVEVRPRVGALSVRYALAPRSRDTPGHTATRPRSVRNGSRHVSREPIRVVVERICGRGGGGGGGVHHARFSVSAAHGGSDSAPRTALSLWNAARCGCIG